MKRIELNIYHLCEEIDELKDTVQYWKIKYEKEKKAFDDFVAQAHESQQQSLSQLLTFCFAFKETPDGSLVISPESKEKLKEDLK